MMELASPGGGPQIKGQLLVARLEHLRAAFGSSAIGRLLERLAWSDAELMRDVSRERWYPFGLLHRVDEAIARELAPDDPEIYEHLGWASAHHRTEWLGEQAALVSVHGFLARAAEDHRRFHSFGRAEYRRQGFTSGELHYAGYPESYTSFCRASRGYFLGVIELLTGQPGEVEEPECQCRRDPACLFVLRWKSRPAAPVQG